MNNNNIAKQAKPSICIYLKNNTNNKQKAEQAVDRAEPCSSTFAGFDAKFSSRKHQ